MLILCSYLMIEKYQESELQLIIGQLQQKMNESHVSKGQVEQNLQALKPTLPINMTPYKHSTPHLPTQPRMNSPRKRLQIFKGYNPRLGNSDLQDEETVIINPRKYTSSSADFHEDPLQIYQRQPFQEIEHGSKQPRKERDSTKTNRRHIFSKPPMSPRQARNQQLSKTNSQESLIPTQRFRQNIDNGLTHSKFQQIDRPPLVQTRSQISPIKFAYSSLQRESTLQKKYSIAQPLIKGISNQLSLPSSASGNVLVSPKKITFTYQPTSIQQLAPKDLEQPSKHPLPKEEPQSRSQIKAATVQYLEPPIRSFKGNYSQSQLQEENDPVDSKVKKSIFLSNKRGGSNRKTVQGVSWGNRIRTELIGEKANNGIAAQRKENVLRTALVNCRESIIVGSKLNRNSLKIDQSFSNISDNQSSKRYYDEDFELPQLKKISYNNIDLSRDSSFVDEHEEDFKTNQLFGDFHPHGSDLEPSSPTRILRETYHRAERSKPAVQDPILKELAPEIKEEKKSAAGFSKQKLLPLMLVVLASMLLLIQLAV